MASMMVGATFYALFIGHMSSLLVNMDAPGRVYNEKVRLRLMKWSRDHELTCIYTRYLD
jgi:hypothetical protein